MLVFLLIVLSVYGLVNFYIFRRGLQALAAYPRGRWIFIAVFLALVLAYPAGRMLVGFGRNSAAGLVVKAGSLHLALMIYLLLGVIVIDLCRLVNSFWPMIPRAWASRPGQTGAALFLVVAGASLLVIIGGAVNAARPRLRELAISIDKSAGSRRGLTIVMASDVHLGTIAGSARLKMLVDRTNALEPDIVLLPGDIVDESVTAGEEEEMTAVFRKIRAPLGVYSVPGNHEYYGGLERNLAYLRDWGIKVLQDEAVLVDGSFYIIGRRDPTALRRGEPRMPIGEIMRRGGVDPRLPLILLDHQPIRLEQAEQSGIDLQLSGHTHAGQLFPINLINKAVYEQNWGSLVKGKTHYYVSCGVGTWGPPVRTGSVPEILRIRLTFRERP
ncbi:MAG: metallophosphoesterase [Candidatus Aminicenantales bacterium]